MNIFNLKLIITQVMTQYFIQPVRFFNLFDGRVPALNKSWKGNI